MSIHKIKRKHGVSYKAYVTSRFGQRTRTFKRKVDAEKWKLEVLSRGVSVESPGERLRCNFTQLANEWLLRYADGRKAESSIKTDQQMLRNHLLPRLGQMNLSDITARDIEIVMNGIRKEKNLGPKALNNVLGLLKKILKEGVRWGYIDASPAAGIQSYKVEPTEYSFWTNDEVRQFLSFVSERNENDAFCFSLALYTGMRAGELRALQWDCVDLQLGQIAVRPAYCGKSGKVRESTKSNRVRYQPIHPKLMELLRGRRKDSGLVVECFDWNHAAKKLRSWASRAGVRSIRFHDLRHTFASVLAIEGVSLYKVSKLMGHSSLAMTQRYAHLAESSLKEVVSQKLDF